MQTAPRKNTTAPMGAPVQPARLFVIFAILAICATLTAWKLVDIQLVNHKLYEKRAESQYTHYRELDPDRGLILDRRGRPLVENLQDYGSVAIRPDDIEDVHATAQRLATALGMSYREVLRTCKNASAYTYIARQVKPDRARSIRDMRLPGVEVLNTTKRSYPYETVAAQVLGHVNVDQEGSAGIERLYDEILAGKPGWEVRQRDAHGGERYDPSYPRQNAVDGGQVRLAIDIDAQAIAEEELQAAVKEHEASGGMVVITRPMSGEILALASYPGYDPNDPSATPFMFQKNRAVTDVYEPGSTFKIVPYAAVIDRDLVWLDEVVDLEKGRWRVANRIIRDSHRYDSLTVRKGFSKSSNILTGKLACMLSQGEYYTVMRDFGFGQETGIDFIGEVGGILAEPRRWSGVSQANMAMGQGVAVTALQLAMAYGAVANDGWLLRPLLVESTTAPDGTIQRYTPLKVRRVMLPSTARTLRKLMIETVEEGTGGNAAIEGISVAGKTGTAEIPDPEGGGYLKGHYVASFAGFLPAEQPEWLAIVVLEDPQGEFYYGGSVAAPAFRKIMQRLLVTLPVEEPVRTGDLDMRDPRKLPQGYVLVPSLQGYSLSEVRIYAAELELNISVSGSGGVVVEQDPAAGTPVKVGETIHVVLQGPTRHDLVLAPDVRDMNLRRAIAETSQCGLIPAVEGAGIVVEQHPAPGEKLRQGETIRLVARPMIKANG